MFTLLTGILNCLLRQPFMENETFHIPKYYTFCIITFAITLATSAMYVGWLFALPCLCAYNAFVMYLALINAPSLNVYTLYNLQL